ncbi:uncharacterized protein [Littorina saxatilis]|uniref:uncharacterized protein isoform X1 n=1 Tax=Littorina saxatilis TaxID=31220 RepID=UPI0038B64CFD
MLFSCFFLALIMCFLVIEQQEASSIENRNRGYSNGREKNVQTTTTQPGKENPGEVEVQRIKIDDSDETEKSIELEALDTIRQMEALQGAVDIVAKKDKEHPDGQVNRDSELGQLADILKQYSEDETDKSRIETKKHKIRRIITHVDAPQRAEEAW